MCVCVWGGGVSGSLFLDMTGGTKLSCTAFSVRVTVNGVMRNIGMRGRRSKMWKSAHSF
mgnify:CR=1 FL=1